MDLSILEENISEVKKDFFKLFYTNYKKYSKPL